MALSDRCQVAKSWRRTERDRFGVVHRINQSDFDDEQPLTSGGWKNFCALFRGGDEMGQPLQGRSSSRCCCLAFLFHFYSISISFLLYILLIGLDYFHCRERLDSASKLKKGHQMWVLCFSALKTPENSLTEGCCCFFRGPQDVAEVEVSLQKEWCFSQCFYCSWVFLSSVHNLFESPSPPNQAGIMGLNLWVSWCWRTIPYNTTKMIGMVRQSGLRRPCEVVPTSPNSAHQQQLRAQRDQFVQRTPFGSCMIINLRCSKFILPKMDQPVSLLSREYEFNHDSHSYPMCRSYHCCDRMQEQTANAR